eukprot:2516839-Ditylum_brightwellii.AAC.1
MASLYKTVQSLSVELLDKYAFETSEDQRIEDLILSLCDVGRACHWREFWHKRSIDCLNERSNDANPPPKEEGLGTGLMPEKNKPKPPRGSYKLEQFLELLETELRTKVLENGQHHASKDKKLNNFFSKLAQASTDVVVPTDKTNGHCSVDLNNYISWVKQHMREAATPIRHQEIVKLHHPAISYAKQLEDLLSDSELAFLNEGINSRDIPKPQLPIKDHKKHKGNHFPTHLVIPAT